ncbi:MAG: hypothetical protein WCG25_09330 [bacterium]
MFHTFQILFDVVRYFHKVLSAKAIHIATSLSTLVSFTTSSRKASSL